jgi:hypothetical protein
MQYDAMRKQESGDDDIDKALGQGGRGRGGAIGRGATGANIHAMKKNKRNFVKL